jgi:hypothetical protein
MWKTSQKVIRPLFASGPGVGHVGSFTPAPWTLVRLQLYLSRNHTHVLQFRTADIISAVEFDSTGNYLATGDKGGRVVLFERNDQVCPAPFVAALLTVANLTP